MYLAHGVRTLAGVALGVATVTMATVTIATAATATTGTAPGMAAAPTMTITRGIQHQQREPRTGPSTTAECEQAIGIACYDPAQIQRAYNLRTLYSRRVTGEGATIVIMGGHAHTVRGFGARTGYNLAVGLGTVNGRYFVPELARLAGR